MWPKRFEGGSWRTLCYYSHAHSLVAISVVGSCSLFDGDLPDPLCLCWVTVSAVCGGRFPSGGWQGNLYNFWDQAAAVSTYIYSIHSFYCLYTKRYAGDVSRFYDVKPSLSNGGNYYQNSQGSWIYGWDFTPQQGNVVVGVTFTEDKSLGFDPTTTNSVEFSLFQGGADAYWKGFTYYPFSSGGCAGATLATGRIWGIGKKLCFACMYFAHL